jgi:hypothetical protein
MTTASRLPPPPASRLLPAYAGMTGNDRGQACGRSHHGPSHEIDHDRPCSSQGHGGIRSCQAPSTKYQAPSTCRGEGPLRPPGTTPPEVPSPRGVAHTAQPGGTGGGAPVDRNAGAGAGAATHPVSPMPAGACPSGSHPSQEGIFAWATLLRRSCQAARARSPRQLVDLMRSTDGLLVMTRVEMSLHSFQVPSTRRGEGPLRPPSTKYQAPVGAKVLFALQAPSTKHQVPLFTPLPSRCYTSSSSCADSATTFSWTWRGMAS